MPRRSVAQILKDAEGLSTDDKLALATRLVDQARATLAAVRPRRRWAELAGSAPYPLAGKDAQEWVREERARDDERGQG